MSNLKIWMTPTPSEAARDTTNAINSIVLQMAKRLPEYGVELVEEPDNADLYAGHAGQGSQREIDVAHFHGLYPTAQGSEQFAVNAAVIKNLRTAKTITAPSNWIADLIRRDMHINPHIIPWGVDTDEWQPGTDPHVYAIWNKARVDNVSNPQPMLELAARAHDTLFLTTFGQGTPNVRTIGRQPYEKMKDYVRNAAVYLSTNVETFGLGILEACAAGVPILGFRQGAIADYIQHGIHGFLAEPGDMEGLYEGLDYCIRNRDTLGMNARELAKTFTWDATAQGFAAVYNEVLEPHEGAKVSVIIPCHNYEEYLREAIESVLGQETVFDFETIVVCDRCSDGSERIARSYESRGVTTILADNGNLSATRNDGIRKATGQYIVCLDADDRLGSPRFLQTLADALDADRTLGIAFTGITVMDSEGTLRPQINPWPHGYNFDLQAQRKNQVPSCCMFRREAWRRAGGFRPHFTYVQDAEFWTTVGSLGYGGKQVVTEGWFHYRIHSKSQSVAHRSGEVPEPNWLEWHPWALDGQRPFAADGKPPRGSWPVRFYNAPKVSVIIPVGKGHERALGDALHSVEGQTERLWECIVVNDTGAVLELDGFPYVKIITTRGGIGAGAARNAGAKLANAPFVVFLDADDMLKPRFLEATLKAYTAQGRYAYTDWLTHEKQTNWQTHETPDYGHEAIATKPSLHPVTALIPKAWFDGVGGFDESLSANEDVDFYMKLFTHGFCGVRVKEPLLIYNMDSGFRRKNSKQTEPEFKALLIERYGAYMRGEKMCNCVEPPKGLKPTAPTPDNLSAYKDTYGDMVKIQLTGQFVPEGAAVFKGPATRVNYGRRSKNDVFYVWEQDVLNSEGVFTVVENYATEPAKTEVPPVPEIVIPSYADGGFVEGEPETVTTVTADGQMYDIEKETKPKVTRRRRAKAKR